jgi:hypothetical protein
MKEPEGPVSTCGKELLRGLMEADRPYGEFYDFFSVSLEYFGYHLVF